MASCIVSVCCERPCTFLALLTSQTLRQKEIFFRSFAYALITELSCEPTLLNEGLHKLAFSLLRILLHPAILKVAASHYKVKKVNEAITGMCEEVLATAASLVCAQKRTIVPKYGRVVTTIIEFFLVELIWYDPR